MSVMKRFLITTFIIILSIGLPGCVEMEKKPEPAGADISASRVVCINNGISTICKQPSNARPGPQQMQ